ncbi:MAG: hypothetical protein R3Y49_00740 [Rikenellaceae bacterium]
MRKTPSFDVFLEVLIIIFLDRYCNLCSEAMGDDFGGMGVWRVERAEAVCRCGVTDPFII